MKVTLTTNGETQDTFIYTGGKAWVDGQPTAVMIHGVLNDHSVWILQSRYLAHHGYNVLALDLPGHGQSTGAPPATVEAAAAHIWALLDALKIEKAALIGHSFGALIALQAAAERPAACTHLGLVGIAYPMRVSPVLLELSQSDPLKAIDMVNTFSHSTLAPPPSALGPGTWLYGASRALMRRILRSNRTDNVFHIGFNACNQYAGGEAAMGVVTQHAVKTRFVLADGDQMTPPKATKSLTSLAPHATTAMVHGGHQLMLEAPEETLRAIADFLTV